MIILLGAISVRSVICSYVGYFKLLCTVGQAKPRLFCLVSLCYCSVESEEKIVLKQRCFDIVFYIVLLF